MNLNKIRRKKKGKKGKEEMKMQEEIFFTKGAFAHLTPQIFVVLILKTFLELVEDPNNP